MKKAYYLWILIVLSGLTIVSCAGSSAGNGEDVFAIHPTSFISSYQTYRPQVEDGYARAACIEMAMLFAGSVPNPQVDIMNQADVDNDDLLTLAEMRNYLSSFGGLSMETYEVRTGLPPDVGLSFALLTDEGKLPLVPLVDGHMYVLAGYAKAIMGTSITTAIVLDPASPGSGRGKSKSISMDRLQQKMSSDCNSNYCFYYGLVESSTTQRSEVESGDPTVFGKSASSSHGGDGIARRGYCCLTGEEPWIPRTFEDTVRMYAASWLLNQNGGTGLSQAGAWFGSQFADGYLGDVIPTSAESWEPGSFSLSEEPGPSIYMYVVELRTNDIAHQGEVIGGIGLRKGHLMDSALFTAVYPFLSSGGGAEEPVTAVSRTAIEQYYGNPAVAFVSEQDKHVALPLCDMPNWLTHDSLGQEVIIDFWGKILTWRMDAKGHWSLVDSGRRFGEVRNAVDGNRSRSAAELTGNSPNPFNPETRIDFGLTRAENVTIEIFNALGQRVRILLNEHRSAGSQSVLWDGKDDNGVSVSSGIYFYRLSAGDYTATKKMVLVK